MTPDVTPTHKKDHGDLGDQETSQEGLSPYNGEKEIGHETCGQAVLETTELVFGDPVFTILEVDFGCGRDRGIVNEEVNEL